MALCSFLPDHQRASSMMRSIKWSTSWSTDGPSSQSTYQNGPISHGSATSGVMVDGSPSGRPRRRARRLDRAPRGHSQEAYRVGPPYSPANRQYIVDAVAAAIGPLVTALLTALGLWFRESRQRRNRQGASRQALNQAHDQVAFIEAWLRTYQQLASPEQHEQARQRALSDLQEAYAHVDQTLVAVRSHRQRLTVRRVLAKLLLLDSKPRTTAARVLGVMYYMALAWFLLAVAVGVSLGLELPATSTSDPLLADIGQAVGLFLITLVLGVAPALPLYWLAMSAARGHGDAPANRSHGWASPPVPQAPQPEPPPAWKTQKEGGPHGQLPSQR
jgi:hypothetical protein